MTRIQHTLGRCSSESTRAALCAEQTLTKTLLPPANSHHRERVPLDVDDLRGVWLGPMKFDQLT